MGTISQNLQKLVDAKNDIAAAITAKGGTVASGDGFEEFAADIATIPGPPGPIKPVRIYIWDNSWTVANFREYTKSVYIDDNDLPSTVAPVSQKSWIIYSADTDNNTFRIAQYTATGVYDTKFTQTINTIRTGLNNNIFRLYRLVYS